MRVVALIPARGGSKRIPRKNLQIVGGETLVERAIHSAQSARIVSAVYVSTEDPEISAISLAAGARVLDRPRFLASDDARMDDVMLDFLMFHVLAPGDVVILLEPTAPLRTVEDINAIAAIMLGTNAPAARIVSATNASGCHGFEYRDAGLASAVRVGAFRDCLFPSGTLLLHTGDERAIDVDSAEDLERARALA